MTRKEASEELKEGFEIFKNGIDPTDWENPNEELRKIIEANTMAIEALEQEPCDDCISRQAVDDAMYDYSRFCDVNYSQLMEFIDKIPSVTPAEKVGHWTRELIRNERGGCIGAKMICSECGQDNGYDKRMRFCHNCGSYNGGGDNVNE